MISFFKEFFQFIKARKTYYLLPILLMLIMFGVLVVMTKGTAVAHRFCNEGFKMKKIKKVIMAVFFINLFLSAASADYYDYRNGERYYCTLSEEPTSGQSCSVGGQSLYCENDKQTYYAEGCSVSCSKQSMPLCSEASIYARSLSASCEVRSAHCRCL